MAHAAAIHCPHGHPYDLLNTIFDKRGYRRCKICKHMRDTVYRLIHRKTRLEASCLQCGTTFKPYRPWHRFCNPRCQTQYIITGKAADEAKP